MSSKFSEMFSHKYICSEKSSKLKAEIQGGVILEITPENIYKSWILNNIPDPTPMFLDVSNINWGYG